jgi:hypothetical protein
MPVDFSSRRVVSEFMSVFALALLTNSFIFTSALAQGYNSQDRISDGPKTEGLDTKPESQQFKAMGIPDAEKSTSIVQAGKPLGHQLNTDLVQAKSREAANIPADLLVVQKLSAQLSRINAQTAKGTNCERELGRIENEIKSLTLTYPDDVSIHSLSGQLTDAKGRSCKHTGTSEAQAFFKAAIDIYSSDLKKEPDNIALLSLRCSSLQHLIFCTKSKHERLQLLEFYLEDLNHCLALNSNKTVLQMSKGDVYIQIAAIKSAEIVGNINVPIAELGAAVDAYRAALASKPNSDVLKLRLTHALEAQNLDYQRIRDYPSATLILTYCSEILFSTSKDFKRKQEFASEKQTLDSQKARLKFLSSNSVR